LSRFDRFLLALFSFLSLSRGLLFNFDSNPEIEWNLCLSEQQAKEEEEADAGMELSAQIKLVALPSSLRFHPT
jgi:hypothetical protein